MNLTLSERAFLAGAAGPSVQKAMEILVTLGEIYGAEQMIPVNSVQISGVSYDNLGEAGLEWLTEMYTGGGRTRVFTTLNPAGMDIENYVSLGISESFAENQRRVLSAFRKMGVVTTCSCTPYLFGNLPHFGEHIAWAESSAVCYANSVIGARTNREGGPSALASALTGVTPAYGLHLSDNRQPTHHFAVSATLTDNPDFGALGKVIGDQIQTQSGHRVPYISGIPKASLENLKSFCASIATFGGVGLFHMEGITPEAAGVKPPDHPPTHITAKDIESASDALTTAQSDEVDFVSLGCPHLSLKEIQRIAELLDGRQVTKPFWITTSRPVKGMADQMGYTDLIEGAGAVFATDTCCVVAPIRGRFHVLATDSAKACYYADAKHSFRTRLLSFDDVVREALR